MCDTVYIPGSSSSGRNAFFAKNSDRNPDEPQAFFVVPERERSRHTTITGGYTVGIRDEGYPYCVSRPSWMWGGEMGVNAYGVAIGNEAVFARLPVDKSGILGMDILRLALQSSQTATETVCAHREGS